MCQVPTKWLDVVMLVNFLRFLTPTGVWDAVGKIVLCLIGIVIVNVAFAELYLGYQPVSLTYFVLVSSLIATPLLSLYLFALFQQERMRQHYHELSRTDPLTGALNRRAFLSDLDKALRTGADRKSVV